ncbi:Fusaric acid resistance protein-like-domain-containing protein [Lipomyces oligophaga]|uniref:Fusaric acid resistance protein-like-domain-containing protein n=1 Tax=Lipomyces oligophaga TaxID=45792 RepID=UPI0034CD5C3C
MDYSSNDRLTVTPGIPSSNADTLMQTRRNSSNAVFNPPSLVRSRSVSSQHSDSGILYSSTFSLASQNQSSSSLASHRLSTYGQSNTVAENTSALLLNENATGNDNNATFRPAVIHLRLVRTVIRRINSYCICAVSSISTPSVTGPLKCALAYLIASLLVFNSSLSHLIGLSDGKHLAATATVYFHAARTVGSMIEAAIYAELALTYSAILSTLSMLTAQAFGRSGMLSIGHIVVLVVFGAGGLGSIGYIKQKVGRQSFSTACSLASVSFASILIREGSIQAGLLSFAKLIRISLIVNSGILIATCTCFVVSPTMAKDRLGQTYSSLLLNYVKSSKSIVDSFLHSNDLLSTEFQATFKATEQAHRSLDSILHESKFEFYVFGRSQEYSIHLEITRLLEELMQSIGSMKCFYQLKLQLLGSSNPSYLNQLFGIYVCKFGLSMETKLDRYYSLISDVLLPWLDGEQVTSFENQRTDLVKAQEVFSILRKSTLHEMLEMDKFKDSIESNHIELATSSEEVIAICDEFSSTMVSCTSSLIALISAVEQYEEYLATPRLPSWKWATAWRNLVAVFLDQTWHSLSRLSLVWNLSILKSMSVSMVLEVLQRSDVLYGAKVGIGAMMFTLPAYIPLTRHFFQHYRMEWGLVSFVIVMNVSIGGTLTTSFYRILGTFIGTTLAYLAWKLAPANEVLLPMIGFLISIFCFGIILTGKPNSAFGRFILLTFNLTAFYSYSLSMDDYDEDEDEYEDEGATVPFVGEIAFHRILAVSLGVLWGLFVTLYILPNSAKTELRTQLAALWNRMGLTIRKNRFGSGTQTSAIIDVEQETELEYHSAAQTYSEVSRPKVDVFDDALLIKSLFAISPLVKQASKEFGSKYPFASEKYEAMITRTRDILDSLHVINMALHRMGESQSQTDVFAFASVEISKLNNSLFLLFRLISLSFRMGRPLSDDNESTEDCCRSAISRVNNFRTLQLSGAAEGQDEDLVVVYSYILEASDIHRKWIQLAVLVQEMHDDVKR